MKLPLSFRLLAALALAVATSLWLVQPSSPAAASADPSFFSAERAQAKVRVIAREAHFIGTPQNAAVRDYLLGELRALGLEPQVQTGFSVMRSARRQHQMWAGLPSNIVVRVPGQASEHGTRKALLLAAHYDSVQHGPGGADDAASVAAILETLRALRHGAPLLNDVVVLFTDGEEVGLLGARAFVAQHPWAKDVGLALNFEYRGNSGAMQMFETSAGNGKLIAGLARAVPHPVANSLNYEVYKRLPNDTDLTALKQGDLPGMNFAAIDGHVVYHTPLDTPEAMNLATLQHEGDTMLALVRHFGKQDLSQLDAPDAVYFDIAAQVLVHYPQSLALPLCIGLTLIMVALTVVARRRQAVRWERIGLAALAFALLLVVLAAMTYGVWQCVLWVHPQYRLMFMGTVYNGMWYELAFASLLLGAYAALTATAQRWLKPDEWQLGVALVWLLGAWTTALWLPGVSWLLLWPVFFVALAHAAALRRPDTGADQRAWLACVGVLPATVLTVPLLHAVYVALGPNAGAVFALLAVLWLGLCSPVVRALGPWLAPGALAASALFLLGGAWTSGFDAEHPQPTSLYHFHDADNRQSYWVSDDVALNAWNQVFFKSAGTRVDTTALMGADMPRTQGGASARTAWLAPAPDLGQIAPQVSVVSDQTQGQRRSVTADIRSVRAAPQLWVALEGATVQGARVNGEPASEGVGEVWEFKASGMQDATLRFTWELSPDQPFTLRVKDRSFGWPGFQRAGLRPPEFIAKANLSSDSVFVQRTLGFPK